MSSANRDAGLVRIVGPVSLAASMVSIVIGAGIFVVPAQLSQAMGSLAPLAILGCAVVVGAVGLCLAESGSRVPSSGGIYAAVEAAFGARTGYVVGLLFCLSNLLACAAVSSAFADAVAAVMPASVRGPLHGAVTVTTVAIIAGLNMRGIGVGAKLVGITTLLKLAPLALFLVAGAFAVNAHNFVRPAAVSPAGIARSLLFALYALQGFEASLCVSGEVREPARTIPRAILLALSATTLVYVAIQFVAQGILGGALASSNVPLADALAKIHPALGIVMLAGAAVSMFGFIASDVFSNPRILFAFARDGLLPRALGRVNRQHAPHVAIAVYATLTILLALSGSFAQLAAPAALVMSLIYIAGCSASWWLVRAGVAQTGAPLGSKWIGAAATLAILGMVAMIVFASGKEMIGLLILIGLALLAYTVQTRFLHPRASGSPEPAA